MCGCPMGPLCGGSCDDSWSTAPRNRTRRRMMGWMAPLRHRRAKLVFSRITRNREPSMSEITTIGLDLAKHVFQAHGIDAEGTTVLRKRLRRGQVLAFFSRIPRCVVGLEACATAHYWARELGALGHEVRLMPAQYVKAYIKRNKHDAADAEAICEAVQRPTMRFVPVKTTEQQATALLHRGREQLVRQREVIEVIRRSVSPYEKAKDDHDAGECVAGASGGVRNGGCAARAPFSTLTNPICRQR